MICLDNKQQWLTAPMPNSLLKSKLKQQCSAETLWRGTVTKPAKRLLGIAAKRCSQCEFTDLA